MEDIAVTSWEAQNLTHFEQRRELNGLQEWMTSC